MSLKRRLSTDAMTLLLYTVLIAALLTLVVSGAKLYAAATETRAEHTRQRAALSYVQSQVCALEGGGLVGLAPGPEGNMLCLREPEGAFETRIYLYDGTLRSLLCRRDTEQMDAEQGERICQLDTLEFAWREKGLLEITADGMTAYAACFGGGSHE